jgi:dihydroorotase
MRPGDVLTHCSTGASMRVVDDAGRVSDAVRRAWSEGVVLDVGHGSGSFSWRSAEALLAAGMPPDVISSDVHALSVWGPMFDLPTCLAKLVCLGLPLRDAVRAATARPAELIGLAGEVGTLRPGARADVALFRLERGSFPLYDVDLEVREGRELLVNTLTLVGGRVLPPRAPEEPAPWVELTPAQRAHRERLRATAAAPAGLSLAAREDLPAPPPAPVEASR